jgi:hypothetical protein
MVALVNEHQSYQDVDGKPIVNGFVYVGLKKADTKTNLLPIFSDRELLVALANPQRTDAFGKTNTKIWLTGQHSLLVEDENNVQKLSDQDAGESPNVGNTKLDNVQGTNAITANADPTITALVDKQTYIFTVVNDNTGAVTLDIDSVGAKSITKNNGEELVFGDLQEDNIAIIVFNETLDFFEWTNQTAIDFVKGADIASANPLVVGVDGSYFNVTGTNNFASMTVEKNRYFILEFNGVLTISDGAAISTPNGSDIKTAAGTVLSCFSTDDDIVVVTSKAGSNIVEDPNGNITIPLQSSFSAFLTSTQANKTGNGAIFTMTGAIWTEQFDRNSDFVDGIFTARTTGIYHFSFIQEISGITTAATTGLYNLETTGQTYRWGQPLKLGTASGQTTIVAGLTIFMSATNTAFLTVQINGEASDVIDFGSGGRNSRFTAMLLA